MKKAVFFLSALLFTSISFASQSTVAQSQSTNQDAQSSSFYDSVKSGWNSFLDVLAGKGSRHSADSTQTNAPAANQTTPKSSKSSNASSKTATTQIANKSQEQATSTNGSAYDSIRSGWNSFIDFLTGSGK